MPARTPDAAVDHLVAEYRNLSRASELEAVGAVLGFSFNDVTAKDGWGGHGSGELAAQIDTYAELKQFKGSTPGVNDVMTTDVLAANRIAPETDRMTPAPAVAGEAAASPATAISVADLMVRFEGAAGGVTALDRVGFDVPEGGLVTMLGPSGCGKSTLLRAVADLVPIGGGGISVFGRTPEQARLARDFAFVFQDATLLPWRSALDNVRLPLEVGRATATSTSTRSRRSCWRWSACGGREDALPHELSGGMRQRVVHCRALVCRPRGAADGRTLRRAGRAHPRQAQRGAAAHWRETGTTIMFVTHSVPGKRRSWARSAWCSRRNPAGSVSTWTSAFPRPEPWACAIPWNSCRSPRTCAA